MRTLKERIKNFKMPHTYVILVTIMFIVLILTHIIPAGSYERVEDAVTGKMVVVPDSYAYVDAEAPGLFVCFRLWKLVMWTLLILCSSLFLRMVLFMF